MLDTDFVYFDRAYRLIGLDKGFEGLIGFSRGLFKVLRNGLQR